MEGRRPGGAEHQDAEHADARHVGVVVHAHEVHDDEGDECNWIYVFESPFQETQTTKGVGIGCRFLP